MVTYKSIIVFLTLLVYVCSTNAIPSKQLKCPKACHCYYFRVNWVTDCSESNMTSIPIDKLDPDVYTLIMNTNRVEKVDPFPVNNKLRSLYLSSNSLTKIQDKTFEGLNYLVDIDLSSNLIDYVHPRAFEDSAGLVTLQLQNNPLNHKEGAFLISKSLLYLYLANCQLTTLSYRFFAGIEGLIKVDLSGNPLGTIEKEIFDDLTSLKHLILNNCNLTHISSVAFSSLKRLNILELAGNNLKSHVHWTFIFGNLIRLENLDLRQSGVSNLPKDVFFNNIYLRRLVLAENVLSDLDVATILGQNLVNLDFLDLSYCNLKGPLSEDTFANSSKIRTLILSGNHLSASELGIALSHLSKLGKLSLRNCGLTSLPSNISHKLTSLKELDISMNPLDKALTKAQSAGISLESLEYLNMSFSNLTNISRHTFSEIATLKTLILSGNNLTSFDFSLVQNLKRLEVLELNDCGLRNLNGTAFNISFTHPNLKELRLSKNPLRVPEEGSILPVKLPGLMNLDLSNCNLSYLPEVAFLQAAPNMKHLLLNNNNLNISLKFLHHLRGLEELDLSFNNITTLERDAFDFNEQLLSLKLYGNPWKCDCYVVAIWEWATLTRGNLDVLVGYKNSIESGKKVKDLICHIYPLTTPITFYNRPKRAEVTNKPQWYLKYTWAKYVPAANCSKMSEVTKVSKIILS